jgi:hypothetical protein
MAAGKSLFGEKGAYLPKDRVLIKCLYVDVCYLAEALQCYGYKLDCALYTKTNKGVVTNEDFHKAINELINTTKARHLNVLGD